MWPNNGFQRAVLVLRARPVTEPKRYAPRRTRYTFASHGGHLMKKISFTYWRDGKFYIGFLNQYPDYQTQGTTKSELTENLKDLLKDIESREVPYIRKVEELLVA
jgi:hypothetical protein